MKAMKDKFIVKTEDKERIKVEGELLAPNYKPSHSLSKPKVKQPTLRELIINMDTKFTSEIKNINTRLDNIDSRLDKVDSRLDNIDTRLDNVIKLNNLKE